MKKEKPINNNVAYAYYSKLLNKPFDSVAELVEAEEAYLEKEQAKEDAAAQKKADALKVEEAFKQLNAARKTFKTDIESLTADYKTDLENLKESFEHCKAAIYANLSDAEDVYSEALKAFTEKYPEGYHITLKDGDFETTISKESSLGSDKAVRRSTPDIFDMLYEFLK